MGGQPVFQKQLDVFCDIITALKLAVAFNYLVLELPVNQLAIVNQYLDDPDSGDLRSIKLA